MNRAIFESAKRKFVMTCFASILDPKTQDHHVRQRRPQLPVPVPARRRRRQRLPGADVARQPPRRSRGVDLLREDARRSTPDDVLVWYTDGIVECENDRGEEYGEKRFRAAIRRAAELDPVAMRESVVSAAGPVLRRARAQGRHHDGVRADRVMTAEASCGSPQRSGRRRCLDGGGGRRRRGAGAGGGRTGSASPGEQSFADGRRALEADDFATAEQKFREAISLDPKLNDAYWRLAAILLRRRRSTRRPSSCCGARPDQAEHRHARAARPGALQDVEPAAGRVDSPARGRGAEAARFVRRAAAARPAPASGPIPSAPRRRSRST